MMEVVPELYILKSSLQVFVKMTDLRYMESSLTEYEIYFYTFQGTVTITY